MSDDDPDAAGFNWGLRPGNGAQEPLVEPPVPPEAEPPADEPEATQLIPEAEPAPAPVAPLAPLPESPAPPEPAEPTSAIDALFGETQFKEYEAGVLDPGESPFVARAVPLEPGSPGESAGPAGVSRTQKVLLSVVGGLVAVLALIALFFVGTRLPALLGPAPAVSISTPSPTPTPTSTAKLVGPVAAGIHPWTALLGGECLDPYTSPWAEKFTVVDCSQPHPAQLVFRGTFDTATDPSYPGVEKLQAQIGLLCAAPGVINLAAAGAYNDIQVQGSYAVDEAQWAEGEHDYFCFMSRVSRQPLTGSIAVPPAAPAAPAAP